jgi:hypothetical protein
MDKLHMSDGKRKVTFRFELLNQNEVRVGEVECISAKIKYAEKPSVMRSALFEIPHAKLGKFDMLTCKIRPWFILHMDKRGTVEWPLGIFLPSKCETRLDEGKKTLIISAYDKTIILDEDRLTSRFFISAGSSYVGTIERILGTAGIIFSNIAASDKTFATDMEYPIGMNKRELADELLRQLNYSPIYADENGRLCSFAYINPADRKIDAAYGGRHSALLPQMEQNVEYTGVANVFTRTALNVERGEITSTYVNDDPMNPYSTVRRGRKIVDYAQIDSINSQETLDIFTKRVAIERSITSSLLTFRTPIMPQYGAFTTLFLEIPEILDTPAKFTETAWEMDLSNGGVMKHEARRILRI